MRGGSRSAIAPAATDTTCELHRRQRVNGAILSQIESFEHLRQLIRAVRLLVAQLDTDAVSLELPLDSRMLACTAAAGLIAALVFGVAPAWRAARPSTR